MRNHAAGGGWSDAAEDAMGGVRIGSVGRRRDRRRAASSSSLPPRGDYDLIADEPDESIRTDESSIAELSGLDGHPRSPSGEGVSPTAKPPPWPLGPLSAPTTRTQTPSDAAAAFAAGGGVGVWDSSDSDPESDGTGLRTPWETSDAAIYDDAATDNGTVNTASSLANRSIHSYDHTTHSGLTAPRNNRSRSAKADGADDAAIGEGRCGPAMLKRLGSSGKRGLKKLGSGNCTKRRRGDKSKSAERQRTSGTTISTSAVDVGVDADVAASLTAAMGGKELEYFYDDEGNLVARVSKSSRSLNKKEKQLSLSWRTWLHAATTPDGDGGGGNLPPGLGLNGNSTLAGSASDPSSPPPGELLTGNADVVVAGDGGRSGGEGGSAAKAWAATVCSSCLSYFMGGPFLNLLLAISSTVCLLMSSSAALGCQFVRIDVGFKPTNMRLRAEGVEVGVWSFSSEAIAYDEGDTRMGCLKYPQGFSKRFITGDSKWVCARFAGVVGMMAGFVVLVSSFFRFVKIFV